MDRLAFNSEHLRTLGEYFFPDSSPENSREPSPLPVLPFPKANLKERTITVMHSDGQKLADEILLELNLETPKDNPLEIALQEKDQTLQEAQEELQEVQLSLNQKEAQLEEAHKALQIATQTLSLQKPDTKTDQSLASLEAHLQREQVINQQLRSKNAELLTSISSLQNENQTQSQQFEKGISLARDKTLEIARNAKDAQEALNTTITDLEKQVKTLNKDNFRLKQENSKLVAEREAETSDYFTDQGLKSSSSSASLASQEELKSRSEPSPTEFTHEPSPTDLQDELTIYKGIIESLRVNLEDFGSSDHQKTQALLSTLARLASQAP